MLNEAEKERIRYHLGYLGIGYRGALVLGVLQTTGVQFALESAMGGVLPEAEATVRRAICELDRIEDERAKMRSQMASGVKTVSGVTFDYEAAFEAFDREYVSLAHSLGDLFGVEVNKNSRRLQAMGACEGGTVEPW